MKHDWKRILKAILTAVLVIIVGTLPVGYLSILFSLGLAPLYVAIAFPIVGFGLVLVLAVIATGLLPSRWKKRLWAVYGVIALVCGIYVGHGFYIDSIPTVDDRASLLYDYEPNTPGTKAVHLDETPTLRLTQDEAEHLKLDGATALYPIYAAFAQAVYPEGWDINSPGEAYWDEPGWVACSGTTYAYEALIKGEADMIFCAGPSDDQLAMAEAAGLELHLTPIGREAFVFFVNAENPVTGLTVEEIQGIYSGQITNWRELGGKNQKIRPFQRAENSGSQTALLRLMEGQELMEPETRDRIGGMGGIISEVASYRNHKNAIGFSFRFYSTEMVQNNQIRLLALNGVEPTVETIRDGSYPIASYFYAITASPIGQSAPQETDPTLAALVEWILSDQGQQIIEDTGYVGVN